MLLPMLLLLLLSLLWGSGLQLSLQHSIASEPVSYSSRVSVSLWRRTRMDEAPTLSLAATKRRRRQQAGSRPQRDVHSRSQ